MAFSNTIRIAPKEWTLVTDLPNALLQFKLDLSTRVYWYEDDLDPTDSIPNPDMFDNVGILNDGLGRGQGKVDKMYTNTIGSLWVYAENRMSITLLEEVV